MYSCFGYNLGASLRNSSEIGRLPCKVNNKNTYEDGDSLSTKGQVKATKVSDYNSYNHNSFL